MPQPAAGAVLRHLRHLAAAPETRRGDRQLLYDFVAAGDPGAFAELLRRHGPMVLGACRRLLLDEHDAEDAFQATFLVLARKAASVRDTEAVGGFLYGVARRTAMNARKSNARRRRSEQQSCERTSEQPAAQSSLRELQAVLDEEVGRLPEKYRAPFVLCCLEGQSRGEAARELGCSEGTLSSRVARAREMLRRRLTARGISLSAALTVLTLSPEARSAVPAALAAATLRGVGDAATVPARAVAWAQGVLRAMAAGARWRAGIALLAVTGLIAAGAGYAVGLRPASESPPEQQAARAPDAPSAEKRSPGVDLYGDPLPPGAVARLGTLRFRHGNFASFVRFTPDGRTLVSQALNGTCTWDASTGRQVHSFSPESGGIWRSAALSPDGRVLATANDAGVRLWEVATGRIVRTLATGRYFRVRFAPDGRSLAVQRSTAQNTVEVLDAATGRAKWSWSPREHPLECVEFSADGKDVVAAGWSAIQSPPLTDHTIRFLDAATGTERRRIDLGTSSPNQLALSSDGKLLAAICTPPGGPGDFGGWYSEIRVRRLDGGREAFRLRPPSRPGGDRQVFFSAVVFSPDSKTLLTAGGEDGLSEWDLTTGKRRREIGHELTNVQDLAFSPDGKGVAVAGPGAVRVIDRASGREITPVAGHRYGINFADLGHDGRTVITARTLHAWDAATGREVRRLELPWRESWWFVTDDGRTGFTGSRQPLGSFGVWDLASGKETSRLSLGFTGPEPRLLAVARGGGMVATSTWGGDTVHLVDVASGKRLFALRDPGLKVLHAGFSADGRTLAVFSGDQTAQVWDVDRGVLVRQIGPMGTAGAVTVAGFGEVYAAALSPDGRWLAYGSQRGLLRLFEAATGREALRLDKLPRGAGTLTFSPDSRTLAWASWRDPEVHLLELATGRERQTLTGHRGNVRAMTFSPDGRTLVTGSDDTTALVWDLAARALGRLPGSVDTSPPQLEACWTALASDDASRAYRAVWALAATPGQAVPFLQGRLRPAELPDAGRVARLIAELSSDRFDDRERATDELRELGELAVPALRKALAAGTGAEARRRLERLLEEAEGLTARRLRELRAVEALEGAGTPEARRLLERLAGGAAEARLTREAAAALRRLSGRPKR
jgi:RNA polymerase sigma factor (sigma-70 family)